MKEISKLSYAYYDISRELFHELENRYPSTKQEALVVWGGMNTFMKFASYEAEVTAKDLFIKGYLLGKHGERFK